jgi:hypothetical protein
MLYIGKFEYAKNCSVLQGYIIVLKVLATDMEYKCTEAKFKACTSSDCNHLFPGLFRLGTVVTVIPQTFSGRTW